jgi:segregation and condensation protein A
MLYQREMIENATWSNPGDVAMEAGELEPELNVSLYDLMLVFRDVLKRAEERPLMQLNRDEFSVEQMMGFLFEKIVSANGAVALTSILPEVMSRRALITAFLALLELTRLHAIYLKQDKAFGEITARANPDYELSKSFSPA